MSKNLYEATIMQLKGRALEAYATLDILFNNPTTIPDHTAWVEEILKHTRVLAEHENAMVTLQQYFGARFGGPSRPPPPQPGPPQPSPAPESASASPDVSAAVRQMLEKEKNKKGKKK